MGFYELTFLLARRRIVVIHGYFFRFFGTSQGWDRLYSQNLLTRKWVSPQFSEQWCLHHSSVQLMGTVLHSILASTRRRTIYWNLTSLEDNLVSWNSNVGVGINSARILEAIERKFNALTWKQGRLSVKNQLSTTTYYQHWSTCFRKKVNCEERYS